MTGMSHHTQSECISISTKCMHTYVFHLQESQGRGADCEGGG